MSTAGHPAPAATSPGGGSLPSRIEQGFETVVFASRWIQAPLYAGLIVAELLYAYKFLIELWEMFYHARLRALSHPPTLGAPRRALCPWRAPPTSMQIQINPACALGEQGD